MTMFKPALCILAVAALFTFAMSNQPYAQTNYPGVIERPPTPIIGKTYVYRGYNTLDDAIKGGDHNWVRREDVTEVDKKGGFKVSIGRLGLKSGYRRFDKSGNLHKRMLRNGRILEYWSYSPSGEPEKTAPQLFRYPMKVGQEFKIEFGYDLRNIKDNEYATVDARVRILGWETITVPAGTFKALKIESSGEYSLVPKYWGGTMTETFWLAPKAEMRVVLYSYEALFLNGGSEKNFISLSRMK